MSRPQRKRMRIAKCERRRAARTRYGARQPEVSCSDSTRESQLVSYMEINPPEVTGHVLSWTGELSKAFCSRCKKSFQLIAPFDQEIEGAVFRGEPVCFDCWDSSCASPSEAQLICSNKGED
jgi:hypothetical protein